MIFVEFVRLPDVPVSVILVVPMGVPPVGMWWLLPQPNTSSDAVNKLRTLTFVQDRSIRIQHSRQKSNPSVKAACNANGGKLNRLDAGVKSEGASVVIVAVATTGVVPSEGVTEVGDTVHVDIAGAPPHDSATAWLNPPTGVTVTLKVPLAPCVTVRAVGEAARVKPGFAPVPLSAMICGFGRAVTVIARSAVSFTACEGVRTTLIMQDAFGAILAPQVVEVEKSELAAAGDPLEITAPPNPIAERALFVRVTVW
jgi:hypothetical protein